MENVKQKVWLVTGCSTGLGRVIAMHALNSGYRVAVGTRNNNDAQDIVSNILKISVRFSLMLQIQKKYKRL